MTEQQTLQEVHNHLQLAYIQRSKSEKTQRRITSTDLLKCLIDSHGWMVKDIFFKFLDFSSFPLPVVRPVAVFRLFPPGPSFPSPSSSFRFNFHSSLIACALRTRAADFGMASFRNDSFPGANSDPLALMKNKEYL